jgi:alpha-maltose-1-phosphate synthase
MSAAWTVKTEDRAEHQAEEKPTERASGSNKSVGNQPAVLLSHPTGNQNLRNALQSLNENWMLKEFWTTVAWDPHSHWNRVLPAGLRAQMARRAFDATPKNKVRCVPWREMVRLGAINLHLESLLCSGERPFSVIGMYRQFDGQVAKRLRGITVDAVYAYEGGALKTFREAKRLGIAAVYELPSGYWYWERDLLSAEAERNPQFAGLHPKLTDSPAHMQWKDEELRLADTIFVASRHVHRTLAGVVADEKIRVVNYGAPPVQPAKEVPRETNAPLKVLFVGALIQRKGIGYLLDAIEKLGGQVELTLIGTRFAPNARVDAACQRWRWFETIPYERVLHVMMQSDVLVLPSLSEAFGLVVTEALSCGLPVIITPNVGAGDLIADGREGFIVPICSSDAIAERLSQMQGDRELLMAMSQSARKTAAEKSWAVYRENWASALRGALWH